MTATPALYGQRFDAWFGGDGAPSARHEVFGGLLPSLRASVVSVPVVQATAIGAIAAGVLVLANLLAVGPALSASRLRPAELFRSD